MRHYVIDTGIVAKLFLREEYSAAAQRAVAQARLLSAPDLLWIECASVLRKRVMGGEISAPDAAALLREILRLPVDTYPSWSLIRPALQIALETGRTVYDCMYVALAVQQDGVLLTADERLYNALRKGPYGVRVRWVGE